MLRASCTGAFASNTNEMRVCQLSYCSRLIVGEEGWEGAGGADDELAKHDSVDKEDSSTVRPSDERRQRRDVKSGKFISKESSVEYTMAERQVSSSSSSSRIVSGCELRL